MRRGHCDAAPLEHHGPGRQAAAPIDWEIAGLVDPLIELAQLAWLNAKLHDDIVAEREHLPPLAERARQLAAIVDACGLTARQRRGFLNQIIEFAICDTAWEADDADHPGDDRTPDRAMGDGWRARSAAWMIRHRRPLISSVAGDAGRCVGSPWCSVAESQDGLDVLGPERGRGKFVVVPVGVHGAEQHRVPLAEVYGAFLPGNNSYRAHGPHVAHSSPPR
jgi:hypothetical protein